MPIPPEQRQLGSKGGLSTGLIDDEPPTCFDIDDAKLWEADMSLTGKVKMLFGGTIKPSEAGSHARVETTAVGAD